MRLIRVLAVLLCVQAVALADLKVSRKNGSGGYESQSTVYVKGQRQRTESPQMTTIQQCDLHRSVYINDRTKMYYIMSDSDASETAGASSAPSPAPQSPAQTRRGALVSVTENITDTGERKQMFGFTARHIKTRNVTDAPPEACNPGHTESESDGWYIDLAAGMSCDTDRPTPPPSRRARPDCADQYRVRRTGAGRLGFPAMVTTTYKSTGQGDMSVAGGVTTTMEATDISTVTLDPSLFEIPAGYQQAASMMEMMMGPGGMNAAAGMGGMPGMPSGAMPPGAQPPASGESVPGAAPSVGPKQPGTIRVGVAAINNKAGGSVSLDDLRSRLVGAISGSGVEAVPLDAAQAPAAEVEARQKECDFVLYTDITALKQSAANKIGGMFGRAAGVGGGSDKYESRVDFKLFAVGGASQLESNATAKESGADTSVGSALDKEAKAVVGAAKKK